MPNKMKKAVDEIITALKKHPVPGKKTGSFWEFLKSQLAEAGEWDKKHIKLIEKEIDAVIAQVDKNSLMEMWKHTPAGAEKFDAGLKPDSKQMKADLSEELIGQVMDRMDDNYASRDTFYAHPDETYYSSKKETAEGEDSGDDDSEPDVIPDVDPKFEDDDLLDDDIFEEDEENF